MMTLRRKRKSILGLAAILTVAWGVGKPFSAVSAVLEGFSINTEDKNVTVTLFTDEHVQYQTETQEKQFSIVLPEVQLSEEQLNNGLPVVLDNKNRFIGRAVPTANGKVKIIVPNLPAGEYNVKVEQRQAVADKRLGNPHAAKLQPVPAQPVTISKLNPDKHFENITQRFATPEPQSKQVIQKRPTIQNNPSEKSSVIRLKPVPTAKSLDGFKTDDGSVWNPYVVKKAPVKVVKSSNTSQAAKKTTAQPEKEPVSALSIEEPSSFPQAAPAISADPLWALHALPPANPEDIILSDVSESLAEAMQNPSETATTSETTVQPAQAPEIHLFADLKETILSLPKWLLLTLALFLGGIGLFTLIGAVVLLKILFSPHARNIVMPPSQVVAHSESAGMATGSTNAKSPYASRPGEIGKRTLVEDKASVNAMDYLSNKPRELSQAVQNAALIQFPIGQRSRKARTSRRTPA